MNSSVLRRLFGPHGEAAPWVGRLCISSREPRCFFSTLPSTQRASRVLQCSGRFRWSNSPKSHSVVSVQHRGPRPQKTTTGRETGPERRRKQAISPVALLSISATLLLGWYYIPNTPPSTLKEKAQAVLTGRPLNAETFVPFEITHRQQCSVTSFILTLRPRHARRENIRWLDAHSNVPVLEHAWAHGLWSVEVKHPLIQVARQYTPLPPRDEGDVENGVLRLLVRPVQGGTVSGYLDGLDVGETVELRGPHLGFDLRKRMGVGGGRDGARMLILAGGTGIAPALQAARVVLGDGLGRSDSRERSFASPHVSVIWANRHREDGELSEHNSLAAQVEELGARHPGRVEVTCLADEEGSFISGALVRQAMQTEKSSADKELASGSALKSATGALCVYHSQAMAAWLPGREMEVADVYSREYICMCASGNGGKGGKNVLMVSGPEGFVAWLAGPKTWRDGKELQGRLGGVVGDLAKSEPALWADWLVLKL